LGAQKEPKNRKLRLSFLPRSKKNYNKIILLEEKFYEDVVEGVMGVYL
jgi:hypothetical protein